MFWNKYETLTPGVDVPDPRADKKTGKNLGKYKVSANAIYRPDGKYLPVAAIETVIQDKGSVHVTGCCIGCVSVDRIVVNAIGGRRFSFEFDSVKQAQKALEIISGRT